MKTAEEFIKETSPGKMHGFRQDLLASGLYKHVIKHMEVFADQQTTDLKREKEELVLALEKALDSMTINEGSPGVKTNLTP